MNKRQKVMTQCKK